jgi:hypothetical protein
LQVVGLNMKVAHAVVIRQRDWQGRRLSVTLGALLQDLSHGGHMQSVSGYRLGNRTLQCFGMPRVEQATESRNGASEVVSALCSSL